MIWVAAAAAAIFLARGFLTLYKTGRGRADTIVRCALFIAAASGLTILAYNRAVPETGLIPQPTVGGYAFNVIADKRGRYSRELILKGSGPEARKGVAWVPLDSRLKINDTVVSSIPPAIIPVQAGGLKSSDKDKVRRGLSFTLKIEDDTHEVIPGGEDIRGDAVRNISAALDSVYPRETASLLKGLYFGNKNFIDKKSVVDFKMAGVMHVLAASGLHVGIIILIPIFIGRLFRIDIRAASVGALLLTGVYLFIAGAPVSLTRAAVMFGVLVLQRVFLLGGNSVNALFIAAVIILLIDPADIYGLGFLLSFGATLGILLFYPLFFSSFKRLPRYAAASFSLTMSAQLFVTPIILLALREINLIGLLSNLVVIPAAGLILAASIPVLFISGIHHGAASAAAQGIDIIRQGLDLFTEFMAGAGGHFSSIDVTPFLAAMLILMNLPLVPIVKKRFILAALSILCLPLLWINLSFARDSNAGLLLFRHAGGTAAVIIQDKIARIGGDIPGYEGAQRISDELSGMGITAVILSIDRPTYKNMTGYSYLAKNFLVRECYLSSAFRMDRCVRKFFEVLEADRIEPVLRDFHPPAKGAPPPDFLSPEFLRSAAAADPVKITGIIPHNNPIRVTEIVI